MLTKKRIKSIKVNNSIDKSLSRLDRSKLTKNSSTLNILQVTQQTGNNNQQQNPHNNQDVSQTRDLSCSSAFNLQTSMADRDVSRLVNQSRDLNLKNLRKFDHVTGGFKDKEFTEQYSVNKTALFLGQSNTNIKESGYVNLS